MNAARAITCELRRRERRRFFVAVRHYLSVVLGFLVSFAALMVFIIFWLSLDTLFA